MHRNNSPVFHIRIVCTCILQLFEIFEIFMPVRALFVAKNNHEKILAQPISIVHLYL